MAVEHGLTCRYPKDLNNNAQVSLFLQWIILTDITDLHCCCSHLDSPELIPLVGGRRGGMSNDSLSFKRTDSQTSCYNQSCLDSLRREL